NALAPGARHHRDLEQSVFDAIAALAGIAGEEQNLVGLKPRRCRIAEQARRQMFWQRRQQACIGARESHRVDPSYWVPFEQLNRGCGRIVERKSPPGRQSWAGEVNPWQGSWGVWGTFITPWTSRGSWRFGDGRLTR